MYFKNYSIIFALLIILRRIFPEQINILKITKSCIKITENWLKATCEDFKKQLRIKKSLLKYQYYAPQSHRIFLSQPQDRDITKWKEGPGITGYNIFSLIYFLSQKLLPSCSLLLTSSSSNNDIQTKNIYIGMCIMNCYEVSGR